MTEPTLTLTVTAVPMVPPGPPSPSPSVLPHPLPALVRPSTTTTPTSALSLSIATHDAAFPSLTTTAAATTTTPMSAGGASTLLPASPTARGGSSDTKRHGGPDGDETETQGLVIHAQPRDPQEAPPTTSAEVFATMIRKPEDIDKLKNPQVRDFYLNQNLIIEGLLGVHELNVTGKLRPGTITDDAQAKATCAIRLSFAVNVMLFGLKLFAAVYSSSLAVIASALDSLLDLASGSLIFFISRAMKNRDSKKYPVSKSRMEPLGVIVFAAVMALASVQVIQQSIETVISGVTGEPRAIKVDVITIVVLCIVIGSKFLLWIYCTLAGKSNGLVEALAQDHGNDVKTNIVGMTCALLAAKIPKVWYLDAAGASALSLWIIITWVRSGRNQIGKLVGMSSDSTLIGQLAYLAATHDTRILRVDKVLSYHYGVREMVEVDIVLPETMRLKEAHDIGDALERKIEQLESVERAFVHLDYEWTHKPEHKIIIDG